MIENVSPAEPTHETFERDRGWSNCDRSVGILKVPSPTSHGSERRGYIQFMLNAIVGLER